MRVSRMTFLASHLAKCPSSEVDCGGLLLALPETIVLDPSRLRPLGSSANRMPENINDYEIRVSSVVASDPTVKPMRCIVKLRRCTVKLVIFHNVEFSTIHLVGSCPARVCHREL
jgi:hypothetical protein